MTILMKTGAGDVPSDGLRLVRHFTPNWFAATMGTGMFAVCLAQFPSVPALYSLGETLWVLNILLFIALSLIYAAKWIIYPGDARRIFDHPVLSMFFGCIPMGLATIINGFVIFGQPLVGDLAIDIAQSLWWFDAALAILAGLSIPFAMFTRQEHAIHQMTAVWLLPIVASEVTAGSGAMLMAHLPSGAPQFTMLFASYVLWACSVPLALGILVILFLRMAVHKLPPANMSATSFLALGPIGTGAFGLALFAANSGSVLEAKGLGELATAMAGASLLGAVLLWGYGLWWLAIAIATTVSHAREGLPFNLGWWAFTFPIGVYAVTTLRLGQLLDFPLLTSFGGVLVMALAMIWLVVVGKTLSGALKGFLFADPCLEN
jgi:C4-dicarboxylate transporter/malic acid transport protein